MADGLAALRDHRALVTDRTPAAHGRNARCRKPQVCSGRTEVWAAGCQAGSLTSRGQGSRDSIRRALQARHPAISTVSATFMLGKSAVQRTIMMSRGLRAAAARAAAGAGAVAFATTTTS